MIVLNVVSMVLLILVLALLLKGKTSTVHITCDDIWENIDISSIADNIAQTIRESDEAILRQISIEKCKAEVALLLARCKEYKEDAKSRNVYS